MEFNKGIKINQETFTNLFVDADRIYIVTDLRGADNLTKRNIQQCGIDFAGSDGLVDRNVTYVSLNESACVAASLDGYSEAMSVNSCMEMLNSDGISLYVHEGNSTEYYTRAAMIGVWDTYVLGTCSIAIKG